MVKKGGKKRKKEKKEKSIKDESLASADLEEQLNSFLYTEIPDEVQEYTDTSYTSASFESLPTPVPEITTHKRKKKKAAGDLYSTTSIVSARQLGEASQTGNEGVMKPKKKKRKGKNKKKKKKVEEEVESIPVFKKPKKWKKMSRKERKIWQEEQIEQWRIEKAAEKAAYIAGAKERQRALLQERNDQMEKDTEEQEIRRIELAFNVNLLKDLEAKILNSDDKKKVRSQWIQYLRCDGLPDPRVVKQVNTYLHAWMISAEVCDTECLVRRSKEVLPMLDLLDEFMDFSTHHTQLEIDNLNEVRLNLRSALLCAVDAAVYKLLRDVERGLMSPAVSERTFVVQARGLRGAVWIGARRPTRMARSYGEELSREPTDLEITDLGVNVRIPRSIDIRGIAIRVTIQEYDFLSEQCASYQIKTPVPENYGMDLLTFTEIEFEQTQHTKLEQDKENTDFKKTTRARIKELEAIINEQKYGKLKAEKEELERLTIAEPPVPLRPREAVAKAQAELEEAYIASLCIENEEFEVSMRRYRICAGVLRVDLLLAPPRPKHMRTHITLTVLEIPKWLRWVPFEAEFNPPPPAIPGATRLPEEIEAEMRQLDMEYDKLALIHIDLPETVLWLEPPVVCQWDDDRRIWSTAHIHDVKYNEDKFTVTFRTGVLWPIGMATIKYSNLPFQGWDMKPEKDGSGVLLTLTGLSVTCEFAVRGSRVTLLAIQNAATGALHDAIGKPMRLRDLIRVLRYAALDLFPERDAVNIIEGSCLKEWSMEKHLYGCMALMSRAYNFQWSRWNGAAGRRAIVMQIREAVDKKREASFQLLYVTPLSANIITCTELSPEFEVVPVVGMKKMNSSKKRASQQQLDMMLSCLDSDMSMATGRFKGQNRRQKNSDDWNSLARKLNAVGVGASKTGKKWQQFYPDVLSLSRVYGSLDARLQVSAANTRLAAAVLQLLEAIKMCSYS